MQALAANSDIRKAVFLTVHEFPAKRGLSSVESAAQALHLAPGTVYNKASTENDQQRLCLEEAVTLINVAGDFRILHAFNSACDHSAVPVGDYTKTSDLELLDLMNAEQEAAGERAGVIRKSLEDGRITSGELSDIERAFNKQIRCQLELLGRLQGMAS